MITQQQYQRPMLVTDWNKTVPPSNLISTAENGELVICSIDLAIGLGIQHKNLLEAIQKYLPDIEKFGRVAFQTRPFATKGGNQHVRIALLNENQSLLIGSLSKNTVQVVAFKVTLVDEFDKARRAINELFKKPESLQSEQIAGLVQLCNELTAKLIESNKKADAVIKYREKVYQAKVVEKQKAESQVECEKFEAERTKWRIKFLTFMDRYCKYTCRVPSSVLYDVDEILKKEYGIYLDNYAHRKQAGESRLDLAYRMGFGQQTWEVLAYRLSASSYVTMPGNQ